ncbi:MAG: DHH family phosphoesterase [Christensenellales bacterium]|jgi:phosphoesterase RecJ-like protein
MKAILDFIGKYKSFAIVCHIDPDGDTLGASFALVEALRLIGKDAVSVCQNPIPYMYSFMPGRLVFPEEAEGVEAVIAVDCADIKRLGSAAYLIEDRPGAIIDHHISNDCFVEPCYLDTGASSTCEIVYQLILEMGVKVSADMAENLYVGISTDTGNFCYSNTTPTAFYTASKLLEAGFDIEKTANTLYRSRTLAKTRLIGQAISSMELHFDNRVALMVISLEQMQAAGASDTDFEGVIDFARDIQGIEIALLLRETPTGAYKSSLRSSGKANVEGIAASYGGGGHCKAAGCVLKGNINILLPEILEKVGEELEK